jgi:hypothetical protein
MEKIMLEARGLNRIQTVLSRIGASLVAAVILPAFPMSGAKAGLQFKSGDAPESYTAQLPHGSVSLAATEAVLQVGDEQGAPTLRMRLAGANPASKSLGLRRRVGAPAGSSPWDKVRYQEVYPGVDIVYYGNQRQQLEYDFLVAPEVSPNVIAMAFEGADSVTIDPLGNLVLRVANTEVRFHRPTVYQVVGNHPIAIPGGYVHRPHGQIGFGVGAYDKSLPLVIDPAVTYVSYPYPVSIVSPVPDASGNYYAVNNYAPNNSYVAKLDTSGNLIASASLAFSAGALVVDIGGGVYVAGVSGGTAFLASFDLSLQPRNTVQAFLDPSAGIYQLVYSAANGGRLFLGGYYPSNCGSNEYVQVYDTNLVLQGGGVYCTPAPSFLFTNPNGLASNSNALAVSDDGNNVYITGNSTQLTILSVADGTTSQVELGFYPTGVAADSTGAVYVAGSGENGNGSIAKIYNGILGWTKSMSNAGFNSVTVDSSRQHVWSAGLTQSTTAPQYFDFSPASDISNPIFDFCGTACGNYLDNSFVVELDTDGNILFSSPIVLDSYGYPNAIGLDPFGTLYMWATLGSALIDSNHNLYDAYDAVVGIDAGATAPPSTGAGLIQFENVVQSLTLGETIDPSVDGSYMQVLVTDGLNPANGASVTFTVNQGPTGAEGVFLGPTTVQAPNGLAIAPPLRANTTAGNYTVSATADNGLSVTFNLVNNPDSPSAIAVLSGDGQTLPLTMAFQALQAQVKDPSDNPLPGITVDFTIPPGANGSFPGGGSTFEVLTDANGVATSEVITAHIVGIFTVTATVNGTAISTPFGLTVVPADVLVKVPTDNTSVLVTATGVYVPGIVHVSSSTACTTPPTGYSNSVCYEITTDKGSAVLVFPVGVCITDPSVTSNSELVHYVNNAPTQVSPTTVTGTTICGSVSSLSPFAIAQPIVASYPLTVTESGTGTGTVSSSPAGINCGATCSANFTSGTKVTLTATPGANSTFTGWSGGCAGTGTCTVTVSAATTVTATFTPIYALTVTESGTGTGTVSSSPAGINCGATCSANFTSGTVVTLTATPGAGSTFAGWSGGGCSGVGTCSVTMNAATTVTATFTPIYALTVTESGTGTGTVSSSPAGINCGATCSANFTSGTKVTLTATPGAGSTFAGWSACTGTGACTVTLSAATSVNALFTSSATGATTTTLISSVNPSYTSQPVTFTATVSPAGGTGGTPGGTVKFLQDTTTLLGTATLKNGVAILRGYVFTTAGTSAITAKYSGGGSFLASTSSPAITQVVNSPLATTTTVASSGSPSRVDQTVKFTASVTSDSGTFPPDGETVTFYDQTVYLGKSTLSGGTAVLRTSDLKAGTHTIIAKYNFGDVKDFKLAPSVSSPFFQVVKK